MFDERSYAMTTFWWIVIAFVGGGCAGVLVMSLMTIAGGLPKQSMHVPDLKGSVRW
jgi:hypothetical protein